MRISDWSSDVCSSDLDEHPHPPDMVRHAGGEHCRLFARHIARAFGKEDEAHIRRAAPHRRVKRGGFRQAADLGMGDRKSDVSGKGVSIRVSLGGRRIITTNKTNKSLKDQSPTS